MPPQTITVAPEDAGQRLDRWLVRRLGLPADGVRALCQAGQVRIRGKACSPLRRLYGGEEVAVERPAARPAVALGPALPVLHDDPACLVVDKPADLAVEPAGPRVRTSRAAPAAAPATAKSAATAVTPSTMPKTMSARTAKLAPTGAPKTPLASSTPA